MKRSRMDYTPEFKEHAVRLALEGEKSIRRVAKDLGIPPGTLTVWVREAQQAESDKLSTAERAELRKLRRENLRLQQEVAFAK